MSSKRQISCSPNHQFWVELLNFRWKAISRVTKYIKRLNNDVLREQNILSKLQKDTPEYNTQLEKVLRLTIMIRHFKQDLNHDFSTIKTISSILAKSTC